MCFVFRLIIIILFIFLGCNFFEASLFDFESATWARDGFGSGRTRNAVGNANRNVYEFSNIVTGRACMQSGAGKVS